MVNPDLICGAEINVIGYVGEDGIKCVRLNIGTNIHNAHTNRDMTKQAHIWRYQRIKQ